MARIFNRKTGAEILFDTSSIGIVLMPIDEPEDRPHIAIELYDIDLEGHTDKCPECAQLVGDLGTSTTDWNIDLDGRVYRLDLQRAIKEPDQVRSDLELSDFFDGTRLKLLIDTNTVEGLEADLKRQEDAENYEQCIYLRDRIRQLKAES